MDIQTGKLYDNYADGIADLMRKKLSSEEIEERLIPLDEDRFKEYKAMNRHERRRAARLARKAEQRR